MRYERSPVVVGLAAVGLLAACSTATKTQTVASAPPVAVVTQTVTATASPSATTPASVPTTASDDLVKQYTDAIATDSDPDTVRGAQKLAAPGSPAFVYAGALANVDEAALDGGSPYPDEQTEAAGPSSVKTCQTPGDAKTCVVFADFKVDPAGKIVDLTVNGKRISDRLTAGNGSKVSSNGVSATFLTAYKSIQSNSLFVTLKIQTGPQAVTANLYSATYRGPDGKQRQATNASGAVQIDANSNTIVAMGFASVAPGGTVTLDGCVAKCDSQFSLKVKVG